MAGPGLARRALPYGSWPTPFTPAAVASGGRRPASVALDGDYVWWAEERPDEQGRTALLRWRDGVVTEPLPAGADVGTRVHEYGGGAWWVRAGTVWWVEQADQRLRRMRPGEAPELLTPGADAQGADRWADGDVHPHDGRLVVVREHHPAGGGPADVRNELVLLRDGAPPEVLRSGPDFVAAPRWSPDGQRLAWLEWDHPDMPWDGTRLLVRAADGTTAVVAGGDRESVVEPTWTPDGALDYCSDRDGWSRLYGWTAAAGVRELPDVGGEVGAAMWVFGRRRHARLADGRLVLARRRDGLDRLLLVDVDGTARELDLPWTYVVTLDGGGDRVVASVASPVDAGAVVLLRFGADGGVSHDVLADPGAPAVDPAWLSRPEHVTFPTGDGEQAYAFVYPPTHPRFSGPDGERPPLIVTLHGGPTSAAEARLDPLVQLWTSRGFAVADLDYRGSWGYGRAYRDALHGRWGDADVIDSAALVRHLAAAGRADPSRAVIRGGSAGGFTVLLALALTDAFAAGVDYFGVADLHTIVTDSHKFESRYCDRLIGPLPEAADRYVERSPTSHLHRLRRPLLVLQGLDDPVVPPSQSQAVVDAVAANGVPYAYVTFPGESHGFVRAETLRRAREAELSFLSQVLGFELPAEEGVPRLEVAGLTG